MARLIATPTGCSNPVILFKGLPPHRVAPYVDGARVEATTDDIVTSDQELQDPIYTSKQRLTHFSHFTVANGESIDLIFLVTNRKVFAIPLDATRISQPFIHLEVNPPFFVLWKLGESGLVSTKVPIGSVEEEIPFVVVAAC